MQNKGSILFVIGTRPEAIKMAPIILLFKKSSEFTVNVCVTAQHREMLDQVLEIFQIKPDFDLNIMKENQDLFDVTIRILTGLKKIILSIKPSFLFVHGDTTTTISSSIASFYCGIKICHVEAGLRTFNKKSPFPEEINRQLTSRLADIHFCPTKRSKENLIRENINKKNIFITGNTVIDALEIGLKKIKKNKTDRVKELEAKIEQFHNMILVTGHRRENHGKGIVNICKALIKISEELHNTIIIYPVHLNPNIMKPVNKLLKNNDRIFLVEPLDYLTFIWLMNKSKLILTDSGGIQEEAPSLGKPVVLLRENTERPEGIENGNIILVGDNINQIANTTVELMTNSTRYNKVSQLKNPFGDGNASKRILKIIKKQIKKC